VKINGYPALALMDLQNNYGDLISIPFLHLHSLGTYVIDRKSLNTVIKKPKCVRKIACDIQMDYREYMEKRILYVAYHAGGEKIIGNIALRVISKESSLPLVP